MLPTRKTKDELVAEIKELKAEIAERNEAIMRLERYKQYENAASEIRAMQEAFINSGFTDDQAFEMLKMLIHKLQF